ncbi:MAG: flavodoxin family protein [Muribaculaceae bacterium]|nr:flavodoxin family protein [Muribaculaceae bacterium]
MKIIAINGSPRKGWNSAKLLEKWKDGVLSVIPDAEVKETNIYDLKFTGCRSCFSCKLKGGKFFGACPIPDGIHDLLAEIREADAVGIASPIYYMDLNAYTKCLLERMIFSVAQYSAPPKSLAPKRVSFTILYSMNATEEAFKNYGIESRCAMTERFLNLFYFMPTHRVTAFDTYQFTDYSKYESSAFSEPHKRRQHAEQFPKDLQSAFDEGVKVAHEIQDPTVKGEPIDHTVHF